MGKSTRFVGSCITNFHRVPIIAFLIASCQCIIAIGKSCRDHQLLIMSQLQLIMSDSQVVGRDNIELFIMSEFSACDHVKIFSCWSCNQQLLWNHVAFCALVHTPPMGKLARIFFRIDPRMSYSCSLGSTCHIPSIH